MLDMRFIRENPEVVAKAMEKRNMESPISEFQELDDKRRDLLYEAENLKTSGILILIKLVNSKEMEKMLLI